MLKPRCPKLECAGTEFVGVEGKVSGTHNKLLYICCKTCGAVVGVVDKTLSDEITTIKGRIKS